MSALRPGPENSLTLAGFIDMWCCYGIEETDDRIAHWGVTSTHAPRIASYLPAQGFVERRECRRLAGSQDIPGQQVVWANDDQLVIVALQDYRLLVELWLAEERFHDRLDELAGVAAPEEEQPLESSPKRSRTPLTADLEAAA